MTCGDAAPGLQPVNAGPLQVKTERYQDENAVWTLNVAYPAFSGEGATGALNRRFADWAERIRQDAAASKDWPPPPAQARYSFLGNYSVTYNQNGLLSLTLFTSEYTGGAHTLSSLGGVNFDLPSGQELKLADLFRPDADYISAITDRVRQQIAERDLTSHLLVPFEAITPDQGFYLSGRDLVVYFNYYEYFPYSDGIQRFAMPMESLREILAPRFGAVHWGSEGLTLGGVPLPDGFPQDAGAVTGEPLAEWNRTRQDATRVAWGREHDKLWVLLGVPEGVFRAPRLEGLGEEAGVRILRASVEPGAGPSLALAALADTEDVWAMRLRFGSQGPGVWLGLVPKEMGQGPSDQRDPVRFVQAVRTALGFSADAAVELDTLGYHEPAGLQTAMVLVRDQGELFTVRLGRRTDADPWFVWSVHLGKAPRLSPVFTED